MNDMSPLELGVTIINDPNRQQRLARLRALTEVPSPTEHWGDRPASLVFHAMAEAGGQVYDDYVDDLLDVLDGPDGEQDMRSSGRVAELEARLAARRTRLAGQE